MQLPKEEYARKRIHIGSSVQIENSITRVTAWHHEAHRTVTLVTEFSISTIKDSYIPFFFLSDASTIVTTNGSNPWQEIT